MLKQIPNADDRRVLRLFMAEGIPWASLQTLHKIFDLNTIFRVALARDNLEAVRVALENGADVHSPYTLDGTGPVLLFTMALRRTAAFKLLLEYGAHMDFDYWIEHLYVPTVEQLELIKEHEPHLRVGPRKHCLLHCASKLIYFYS